MVKGFKEMSLSIEDENLALDEALVDLEFPDGTKLVGTITYGQHRKAIAAVTGSLKHDVLWEAEHEITHHKIWMAQRVDRRLLLSVYEQSRQICQVRLDVFGESWEAASGSAKDT